MSYSRTTTQGPLPANRRLTSTPQQVPALAQRTTRIPGPSLGSRNASVQSITESRPSRPTEAMRGRNPTGQAATLTDTQEVEIRDSVLIATNAPIHFHQPPNDHNLSVETHSNNITPIPSQNADHHIYRKHLSDKGRGIPLSVPGPNLALPLGYRKNGVSIGDVGFIYGAGGFAFCFNMFLPASHEVNQGRVPNGFIPFDKSKIERTIEKSVFGGSCLATSCLKPSDSSDFAFKTTGSEGAVLVMPDGAVSDDLLGWRLLESYIAANIGSWQEYLECECGMPIESGDLQVVIGTDKASSWGMATFENITPGQPLWFEFKADEQTRAYKWYGIISGRQGPHDEEIRDLMEETNMSRLRNQCVFVRTLNVSAATKFQDGLAVSEIRACSSRDHISDPNQDQTRQRKVKSKTPQTGLSVSHGQKSLHKVLFQKYPDAKVVITQDSDWRSVITENDDATLNFEDICARVMASYVICEREGVVTLRKRKHISRSGPRSYPNAITIPQQMMSEEVESMGNENERYVIGRLFLETSDDLSRTEYLNNTVENRPYDKWPQTGDSPRSLLHSPNPHQQMMSEEVESMGNENEGFVIGRLLLETPDYLSLNTFVEKCPYDNSTQTGDSESLLNFSSDDEISINHECGDSENLRASMNHVVDDLDECDHEQHGGTSCSIPCIPSDRFLVKRSAPHVPRVSSRRFVAGRLAAPRITHVSTHDRDPKVIIKRTYGADPDVDMIHEATQSPDNRCNLTVETEINIHLTHDYSSDVSTQPSEHDIYYDLLLLAKGRGTPLWEPGPTMFLTRNGVSIGGVLPTQPLPSEVSPTQPMASIPRAREKRPNLRLIPKKIRDISSGKSCFGAFNVDNLQESGTAPEDASMSPQDESSPVDDSANHPTTTSPSQDGSSSDEETAGENFYLAAHFYTGHLPTPGLTLHEQSGGHPPHFSSYPLMSDHEYQFHVPSPEYLVSMPLWGDPTLCPQHNAFNWVVHAANEEHAIGRQLLETQDSPPLSGSLSSIMEKHRYDRWPHINDSGSLPSSQAFCFDQLSPSNGADTGNNVNFTGNSIVNREGASALDGRPGVPEPIFHKQLKKARSVRGSYKPTCDLQQNCRWDGKPGASCTPCPSSGRSAMSWESKFSGRNRGKSHVTEPQKRSEAFRDLLMQYRAYADGLEALIDSYCSPPKLKEFHRKRPEDPDDLLGRGLSLTLCDFPLDQEVGDNVGGDPSETPPNIMLRHDLSALVEGYFDISAPFPFESDARPVPSQFPTTGKDPNLTYDFNPHFDWSRYLPSAVALDRRSHDSLLDAFFRFSTGFFLRIIPDLFLKDMYRVLHVPRSEESPKSNYSPMLHNAIITLGLALSDDSRFQDLKVRQYAQCRRTTLAVVQPLACLGTSYVSQGDQTLGFMYFGLIALYRCGLDEVPVAYGNIPPLPDHTTTTSHANAAELFLIVRDISEVKNEHCNHILLHNHILLRFFSNNLIKTKNCAIVVFDRVGCVSTKRNDGYASLPPDLPFFRSSATPHKLVLHISYWWLVDLKGELPFRIPIFLGFPLEYFLRDRECCTENCAWKYPCRRK